MMNYQKKILDYAINMDMQKETFIWYQIYYYKNSIYYRKTEKDENFLARKTEWSILIQFCIPFDFQLPMGKGEKICIKKG